LKTNATRNRYLWLLSITVLVSALFSILAWTLYRANQQSQQSQRDDALWKAVERGDLPAVMRLLDQGAEPNVNEYQILDRRHRMGIGAMIARLRGREPRYNVDPKSGRWTSDPRVAGNWTTRQKWNTVLWLAKESNHPDIVLALVAAGAKDQATGYLETALMWAASAGHEDIVRSLLTNGSDVNATDDFGYTALDGAVMQGDLEIVELLLQHGADPNKKDPLAHAKARGHTAIATVLEAAQTAHANGTVPVGP
jgi:ankyrin repeat protein